MKKKVFVDTNFFLVPFQFGVDVFSEIEKVCVFDFDFFVVGEVFDELKNIINSSNGRDSEAALFGLRLLENFVEKGKFSVVEGVEEKYFKDADEHILNEVSLNPKLCVVCTQDKDLRNRVKALGGGFILLRSKSHVVLENFEVL